MVPYGIAFSAFQNLVGEYSIECVPASLYNLSKSVPDPLRAFQQIISLVNKLIFAAFPPRLNLCTIFWIMNRSIALLVWVRSNFLGSGEGQKVPHMDISFIMKKKQTMDKRNKQYNKQTARNKLETNNGQWKQPISYLVFIKQWFQVAADKWKRFGAHKTLRCPQCMMPCWISKEKDVHDWHMIFSPSILQV